MAVVRISHAFSVAIGPPVSDWKTLFSDEARINAEITDLTPCHIVPSDGGICRLWISDRFDDLMRHDYF